MGSFADKRICTALFLAVILMAGFYVRFDDFNYWQKYRDEFFFKSEPLPVLTDPDGYYYLDIANEYLAGNVKEIDDRRQAPVGYRKPVSVPLLSFALAVISQLAGQPVEWVAIFLPVFFGLTLAFPSYFLAYYMIIQGRLPWLGSDRFTSSQARVAGLLAGLLALLSPAFVVRSSVGRFDTDMLNVCFASLSVLLATIAIKEENPRKSFYLQAIWMLTLLLFLWWWDFAFWPAVFLAGGPWLIALMLLTWTNPRNMKTWLLLLALSGGLIMACILLFDGSGGGIVNVKGLYRYMFEVGGSEVGGSGHFPITASYVTEQDNYTIVRLATESAGGVVQLLLSVIGMLLLGVLVRWRVIVLLPLAIVASLSLTGGRFVIFLAPLVGLGGAATAITLWKLIGNVKIRVISTAALAIFLVWGPLRDNLVYRFAFPRTRAPLFEEFKKVTSDIKEEGVIWGSWSHGHPLVYYTKKRTIGDGIYHSGSLMYFQNFPLAVSSFKLSANWICFYAKHGQAGLSKAIMALSGTGDWAKGLPMIQDLLAAGPEKSRELLHDKYNLTAGESEDFLAFIFPVDHPPVYLLLDQMFLTEDWYSVGKWDLTRGKVSYGYNLGYNNFGIDNRYNFFADTEWGEVQVNLIKGVGNVGILPLKLEKMVYEKGSSRKPYLYAGAKEGATLYAIDNNLGKFWFITTYPSDSVFLRLFFERAFDGQYFRPVKDRSPLYVLCEVNGDKYVRLASVSH